MMMIFDSNEMKHITRNMEGTGQNYRLIDSSIADR